MKPSRKENHKKNVRGDKRRAKLKRDHIKRTKWLPASTKPVVFPEGER